MFGLLMTAVLRRGREHASDVVEARAAEEVDHGWRSPDFPLGHRTFKAGDHVRSITWLAPKRDRW